MGREIRFRGKRLDNGEWVYGDLLQIGGGCIIYFGSKDITKKPDIPNSSNSKVAVELFMDEIAVVDPKTVGQFSGEYDAFGNEIYEGDLIRYPERDGEAERLAYIRTNQTVVMDEGCFWLVPCDNATNDPLPLYRLNGSADPQVVGNKYDGVHWKTKK